MILDRINARPYRLMHHLVLIHTASTVMSSTKGNEAEKIAQVAKGTAWATLRKDV